VASVDWWSAGGWRLDLLCRDAIPTLAGLALAQQYVTQGFIIAGRRPFGQGLEERMVTAAIFALLHMREV